MFYASIRSKIEESSVLYERRRVLVYIGLHLTQLTAERLLELLLPGFYYGCLKSLISQILFVGTSPLCGSLFGTRPLQRSRRRAVVKHCVTGCPIISRRKPSRVRSRFRVPASLPPSRFFFRSIRKQDLMRCQP